MAEVTRRTATLTDMKGIWALVRQVAADLPVDLCSDAAQENTLSEIMVGCTSELSPVAVGKDKAIVGALIARRDEFEWGLRSGNVIHVTCAAIAPSHKDQGLLQSMLAEMQARRLPIHVSIKSGNRLGLVDELKKLGFEHAVTAADGWGDLYAWQPSAAAANEAATAA
jgi:hypothetical protein